jgi:hypothetical protein
MRPNGGYSTAEPARWRDEAEVQNISKFFRRIQDAAKALRYDNVYGTVGTYHDTTSGLQRGKNGVWLIDVDGARRGGDEHCAGRAHEDLPVERYDPRRR